MSSSVDTDDKKKDIIIFGKGPTQGFDYTTLTAKGIYPINFTKPNKRFVLSLNYNGSNRFLSVNATKIYQFKVENFEIKNYTLFLGNISKDFTIENMKKKKKNRIKRSCKFFFCYFNPIDINNVLDIHKQLMTRA